MTWLITEDVGRQMNAAIKAGNIPSAQQEAEYAQGQMSAVRYDDETGRPRILTIAGGTASIEIDGILTRSASLFALLFGGGNTTYREIRDAIAVADRDPEVQEIELRFGNSPGGTVAGLYEAADAVFQAQKPVRAYVEDMAASASYTLATQAGSIEAANPMTVVGSVGVAQSFVVDEMFVDVTSSDAPDKRPNAGTEEGRAKIRETLDRAHAELVSLISRGRNIEAQVINRDFGRGAVVYANDAKLAGMIDAVAETRNSNPNGLTASVSPGHSETTANEGGSKAGGMTMDLETLKAQHPDVFQAAVAQGIEKGVAQERDRVCGHLKMGETCDAMDTALKAVREGSEMGATLTAEYTSAALNKGDRDRRAGDESDAARAADGAGAQGDTPEGGDGKSMADRVAAAVADGMGAEA